MPRNFPFCLLEPFLPHLPRPNPFVVVQDRAGGLTWTLTSAPHFLILCDLNRLLPPHIPEAPQENWEILIFLLPKDWSSGKAAVLCSSLALDAGYSKVSHFLYFIYLKAFPDTSVQKTWLGHIFSKTIICLQFFPRFLPLGSPLHSDWYL